MGCGPWSILQLGKLHIYTVLTPNMDSSSFVRHQTWQTGLRAKTDMTFLASIMHFCMYKIVYWQWNYLLAVDTGRPPPDKHYILLVCCGTHRSLQNNTIYSSPPLWYSQVSLTITPYSASFVYGPKVSPNSTADSPSLLHYIDCKPPYPYGGLQSMAALTSKVVWQARLSNQRQHKSDQATVRRY